MSHSTEHESTTKIPMYPALRVLERQTPPVKYGRPPYWRAPLTPASEEFYCPVWNWVGPHEIADQEPISVLDVNAAFLAAIGSVKISHSHLIHIGRLDVHPAPRDVLPGYYRVTVPYWAFPGTIVHPLGNSARVETEDTLWIAAPTLTLMLELQEDGHLGSFDIIDSYSAQVITDFRAWAERLKSVRGELIDRVEMAQTVTRREEELARYDAFKTGYSAALSMMLTGDKCMVRRPDWAHAVYAQHSASTWRKAWRWTFTGHPLVSMGSVDEISVLSADVAEVLALPKPPFRLDPTGRQPGAFKPKKVTFHGAENITPQALSPAGDLDEDDIV